MQLLLLLFFSGGAEQRGLDYLQIDIIAVYHAKPVLQGASCVGQHRD